MTVYLILLSISMKHGIVDVERYSILSVHGTLLWVSVNCTVSLHSPNQELFVL